MVAKRMFFVHLHSLYRKTKGQKVSFFGFLISKTVWTNQINIIPFFMRTMAKMMKIFGTFISIEKCGMIMSPLFTEKQEESLKKSGKFITWKKKNFTEMKQDKVVFDKEMQDKLWKISLDLCKDEKTAQISEKYLGI